MKASVRLVRFATIGTLNYLITMLVIWIVMSYFSFKGKYIVANIMAYLIAQTHNFIWSKYWIFPSSNPQNSLWQQIMLFCTAFGIAYGITNFSIRIELRDRRLCYVRIYKLLI